MTIGGSLALIIVGAILKFAVTWTPDGINLQLVGLILLIAGCAGLIASVAVTISRNRRRSQAQVYEERRFTEPPL
jgi:hypothetical protein